MHTGVVFIKIKAKEEEKIYHKLSNTPGIVDLDVLFGRYDLVATIEIEDTNTLWNFVAEKIMSIPGVLDTEPLIPFSVQMMQKK